MNEARLPLLIVTAVVLIGSGFQVAAAAGDGDGVKRLSDPVEVTDDYETFGAPIEESLPTMTLAELVSGADQHVGVPVTVTARIARVCQKKGCFFIARDGSTTVRVSFKDYGFFVPTDTAGRQVTLAGSLVYRDVSEKQARHLAADMNAPADAVAPGRTLEIVATAVRIPRS